MFFFSRRYLIFPHRIASQTVSHLICTRLLFGKEGRPTLKLPFFNCVWRQQKTSGIAFVLYLITSNVFESPLFGFGSRYRLRYMIYRFSFLLSIPMSISYFLMVGFLFAVRFLLHYRFEVHAWRPWSRFVSFIFPLVCVTLFSFTVVYGFGDRMAICFIWFLLLYGSMYFSIFFSVALALQLCFFCLCTLLDWFLGEILYDRRGQFSLE
jgi:hypothetical protein